MKYIYGLTTALSSVILEFQCLICYMPDNVKCWNDAGFSNLAQLTSTASNSD